MSETLRSAGHATDTLKKEHRKEIDPLSGNLSAVQAEADRRADEAAEQNVSCRTESTICWSN